jgi:hypothetical protein
MTQWDTRRRYIKALGDLKNELSREMDRAQSGEELARRDDHLRGLINEVEGYRIRIVREQEIEAEDGPCCEDGCVNDQVGFGVCSLHWEAASTSAKAPLRAL